MPVIYRLDDRDCFVAVNQRWNRFAEENGAPELAGESLIGQPLWRYISGVDVAQIYRELFRKVRERRMHAVFPFRCDSPTVRRDMLMKVVPREGSHLEFHCLTRSILPHTFPATEEADLQRDLARELLRICSWCKDVCLGDEWVALEAAIKRLDLFGSREALQLTHGICPKCRVDLLRPLQ